MLATRINQDSAIPTGLGSTATRRDRPTEPISSRRCVIAGQIAIVVVLLGFTDLSWGMNWLHGMGYVVPAFMSARLRRTTDIALFGAICTGAILIGAYQSAPSGDIGHQWPETLPPIFVVWIAVLSITDRRRIEESFNLRGAQFNALVENSPDGVLTLNRDGLIETVNQALVQLSGYARSELTGKNVEVLIPSRFRHHDRLVAEYVKDPQIRHMGGGNELTLLHRDGHEIPVEIGLSHNHLESGSFVMATVRDITARKTSEKALADNERRLRSITNAIPGAVYQFRRNTNGRQCFTFMSSGINDLLELSDPGDFISFDLFSSFVHPEDRSTLLQSIQESATALRPWIHEFRVITARGNTKWVRGNSLAGWSEPDRSVEWNGILSDVTDSRILAARLSHQAAHDGLTGLLNRPAFEQRLAEALELSSGTEGELALAFVDLDQFKVVNDTCGHGAGDELLRQIAMMFKDGLRGSDVLARLGGDEFAVLMTGASLENAYAVMARIREAIAEFRFVWDGKAFNVGASIGLLTIKGGESDIVEALKRADAACYAAKDAGRNCIHVFQEEDEELASRHGQVRWVPLINAALSQNQFELYSQRIMGITDENLNEVHSEILLRMRLPSGELVSPGAFLPAAERYNLASRIDRWVVSAVFDWLSNVPLTAEDSAVYNINLSGLSIGDAETTNSIIKQLSSNPQLASRICFEITETAAISKLSSAREFIAQLKLLGCKCALDDFGSGISSFGQLKNLDIDFVKIDGMFVRDIARDTVDLAMVTAINEMAHAMGMKTVAEFVEDDCILSILKEIGVDYAQGYFIGRPAPIEIKAAWE